MGKKKKGSGLGCLFWIALILLVLVVFLFNRERIQTVVESTGLRDILANNFSSPEKPEVTRVESPSEDDSGNTSSEDQRRNDTRIEPRETSPESSAPNDDRVQSDTMVTVEVEPPEAQPAETTESDAAAGSDTEGSGSTVEKPGANEEAPRNMRKARLYFVSLDDSGKILLESIVRPVFYVDSPLTESMKSLLQGLTTSELNQGLLSLIPEDAAIRSVKVTGGVAYIDFTEAIRFNAFGKEGYLNQLKQIVYTATEFPTVTSVQIMIEGKIHTYMGPEGVYIGEPLTRDSF